VKILIGRGADLNRPAPDGSTPLLIALLRGHRRIAAVLVKGGADLRPKVYGDDAEAIATAQGMDRVLREIQKRKDAVP
jgi:ankyrin repeat protein